MAFFLEQVRLILHVQPMTVRALPRWLPVSRRCTWVVAAALVAFSAVSCGDNTGSGMERVKQTGSLRVGTDATYPPFETVDMESEEVVGFDADLINEICRELQCSPEFIVTPFDGIISGLYDGKYDVIASSFTITADRAEQVAFSESYYDAGQALAVPVYDTTIRSVEDLAGRTVGVQRGTTGERRARRIAGAHVVSFDEIGTAFRDMENGLLDAVVNDRPTTELVIRRRGTAKIVGPTLTEERYGFAVRRKDRELLEAINNALEAIRGDGRYQVIHDRWFGVGG